MATFTSRTFSKVFILILYCLKFSVGSDCRGCVQLDSFSFDKIISKFDASLVKFDVAYPYGDKQNEFGKVSESLRDIPDLLVAEIGVKDYGEKDNTDLAKKYGVSKDDFPVVILFTQKSKPKTFTGNFKAEDIVNFIRLNSNIYIGLPGCLEEFDKIAATFMASSGVEAKKKILRETEDYWDKVKGARSQKAAEIYVKTMRKFLEKDDFISTELKRIESIMKGKISEEKAAEMKLRINVLKSFELSRRKDEL